MAKIRHIAIRSDNAAETAAFFQEVFGLELIQKRDSGPIDLSDGDINITVLPTNLGGRQTAPGFEHIGFSADDAETKEIHSRLMTHGAKELPPVALGDVYFESKYMSTEGLMVDVGHWRTSAVTPALEAATKA